MPSPLIFLIGEFCLSCERAHMLGKSSRCDEDKIFHNGDFYGENERKNILKAEIRLFCVDCVSNLSKIYSILTLNGLLNSSYCHRDTKMLKFNYLYCDRKQVFIYIKLASLFSIRRSSELSITNSYKFFTKLLTLIKALKSQKLLKVSYNYSYLLRINNAENVRYKNLQDFVTLMSESKPRTNNNLKGKSTKLILKLISFIILHDIPGSRETSTETGPRTGGRYCCAEKEKRRPKDVRTRDIRDASTKTTETIRHWVDQSYVIESRDENDIDMNDAKKMLRRNYNQPKNDYPIYNEINLSVLLYDLSVASVAKAWSCLDTPSIITSKHYRTFYHSYLWSLCLSFKTPEPRLRSLKISQGYQILPKRVINENAYGVQINLRKNRITTSENKTFTTVSFKFVYCDFFNFLLSKTLSKTRSILNTTGLQCKVEKDDTWRWILILSCGDIEKNPGPLDVTLMTLNCRGLKNENKFRQLISRLHSDGSKMGTAIIALQETHIEFNHLNYIWKGKHIFTKGSGSKGGVITLLSDNVVVREQYDFDEEAQISLIEIIDKNESTEIILVNLHSPCAHNKGKIEYFKN